MPPLKIAPGYKLIDDDGSECEVTGFEFGLVKCVKYGLYYSESFKPPPDYHWRRETKRFHITRAGARRLRKRWLKAQEAGNAT